jgi:hypothetical protein
MWTTLLRPDKPWHGKIADRPSVLTSWQIIMVASAVLVVVFGKLSK